MVSLKDQAVEMIQDIPEDKIIYVIDILRGIVGLYGNKTNSETFDETNHSAMGIFKQYANKKLIPMEKDAWAEAVRDQYVDY